MPDIEAVIARQRARVLGGIDGPMLRDLLLDYSRVRARIEREALAIAAQAETRALTPAELVRSARLQRLTEQVENELRALTGRERVAITHSIELAVDAGTTDAVALAASMAAAGSELTVPASERIIAALQRGSPLRALVDEIPAAARQAVRNALVDGIVRGLNPRVTARAVSGAWGGQQARALTIARTETLRAYRGAQLETYQRNPEIVSGWVWMAANDRRTCPLCWAQHGTEHPSSEQMATHPSCRCSMAPLVAGPDRLRVRTGPERFGDLPEATQKAILGPGKFAAYKDGAFTLPQLVVPTRDPRWGAGMRQRSLTSLVGPERARVYIGRGIGTAAPAVAAPAVREAVSDAVQRKAAAEAAYDAAVAQHTRANELYQQAVRAQRDQTARRIAGQSVPELEAQNVRDNIASARGDITAARVALGKARAEYAEAARDVIPEVYQPARTLAEAAAAGKRMGISAEYLTRGADSRTIWWLPSSKGYGSPAAERAALDGANALNAEINRLQRLYPQARATRIDSLVMQRGNGRAHVGHVPTDPSHVQVMRIYPSGKEQPALLEEYAKRNGYMHGTTGAREDVFRHEFAHAMTYRDGTGPGARVTHSFSETVNANLRGTSVRAREIFGQYGAGKTAEGIAETLAIYMHPAYGTAAMPSYIVTGLPNGRLPGWLEDWAQGFLEGRIP